MCTHLPQKGSDFTITVHGQLCGLALARKRDASAAAGLTLLSRLLFPLVDRTEILCLRDLGRCWLYAVRTQASMTSPASKSLFVLTICMNGVTDALPW